MNVHKKNKLEKYKLKLTSPNGKIVHEFNSINSAKTFLEKELNQVVSYSWVYSCIKPPCSSIKGWKVDDITEK